MAKRSNRTKLLATIIVLVVIGLFFYSAGRKGLTDSVTRVFSKTSIASGETISATYSFTKVLDDEWSVEETLPAGWTYIGPTGGGTITGVSSGTVGANTVVRIIRDVPVTGQYASVSLDYKAPVNPSGATYTFNGGYWWVTASTYQNTLTADIITMQPSCTPKVWVDSNSNCFIAADEWTTFKNKWLGFTESNAHLAEAGNIYYTTIDGHYTG